MSLELTEEQSAEEARQITLRAYFVDCNSRILLTKVKLLVLPTADLSQGPFLRSGNRVEFELVSATSNATHLDIGCVKTLRGGSTASSGIQSNCLVHTLGLS